MCARMWAVAASVGVVWVSAAMAQQKDPSTFFGGVNPRDIVYKQVDMSNIVAPVSSPSKMSLGGVLSKFNIPFLHTPTPTPTIPAKSKFPPPSFNSPIQPVMPTR